MALYDYTGQPRPRGKVVLIGAVMDASSDENRFKAMKQLLDIGLKKLRYPDAEIASGEYTYANSGAVALLPQEPSMYEQKPITVLYAKAETDQLSAASTTKVMSLITGMDYIGSVMEQVTYKSSDEESGSGDVFDAGDIVTIRDLMLAMMLPSSNGAAQCFARICGAKMLEAQGDSSYTDTECRAEFVRQMNLKAAYIGMDDSSYSGASGLAATNVSTASDMLRMIVEACSYPDICKVWGKSSYVVPVGGTNPRNVTLSTTVTYPAIEADYTILGGKTGTLLTSARNLVMVVEAEV